MYIENMFSKSHQLPSLLTIISLFSPIDLGKFHTSLTWILRPGHIFKTGMMSPPDRVVSSVALDPSGPVVVAKQLHDVHISTGSGQVDRLATPFLKRVVFFVVFCGVIKINKNKPAMQTKFGRMNQRMASFWSKVNTQIQMSSHLQIFFSWV